MAGIYFIKQYKRWWLLLFLLPCCNRSIGRTTYTYQYNSECAKAYEQYMSLHISEADAILRQSIIRNPYNLMNTYLADYDDYLSLLLNGDKKDYEQRSAHMDERLDLLANGDEHSPWYKLCKAGIYLHWAMIHMRFGENMKAAFQLRRSYVLLKENQEQFPGFQYNIFFYGLERTVIGTVPDDYKWLASIFGLKGNVREGIEKIDVFINTHSSDDLFQREAVAIDCFLKFYLLYKQEDVWKYLSSAQFPTQNNLINTFVKGNMAVNYRKADIAIQTFKEGSAINDFNKFPLFEYQFGCAYFFKMDAACIDHFKVFLNKYQGKLYVKDTWYKMALFYYIEGNMQQANYCREQITKRGNTIMDADRTAGRFGEHDRWPNINLLRAHLLIDGGYYKQAYDILNAVNEQSLQSISDKLEYNFRMGRVCDELGEKERALSLYQKTLNMGRNERDYFAARSALQMAFIYEKAGDNKNALAKYNECLGIHHHDFQSAIDQQAKAGVNRLTVK